MCNKDQGSCLTTRGAGRVRLPELGRPAPQPGWDRPMTSSLACQPAVCSGGHCLAQLRDPGIWALSQHMVPRAPCAAFLPTGDPGLGCKASHLHAPWGPWQPQAHLKTFGGRPGAHLKNGWWWQQPLPRCCFEDYMTSWSKCLLVLPDPQPHTPFQLP